MGLVDEKEDTANQRPAEVYRMLVPRLVTLRQRCSWLQVLKVGNRSDPFLLELLSDLKLLASVQNFIGVFFVGK